MQKLTIDEIRKHFESSKEFNEIFDAFDQAIEQRFNDIELYRQLFWNPILTPDELCFFGEKLVKEFPALSYDVYMWLANVFEVTYSMFDNYELALEYYKKAAPVRPSSSEPYLAAAACHEPDLNIPPITALIDFLKKGTEYVTDAKLIYEKLVYLYEIIGNDEMCDYYRRKLEKGPEPPEGPSPEQ